MKNTSLTGRIHSFESLGAHDGPGLRSVIFLQGCRFRCLYCHNPDTWQEDGGSVMEADALYERVLRFKPYFDSSGGGVTVSGGEPLLQAAFVAELFSRLKVAGVHTCLDTTGDFPDALEGPVLDRLIELTDLVLLDIKQTQKEKHRLLTGRGDIPSLKFAEYLEKKRVPVWLRYVIVPGYTDGQQDIEAFKDLASHLSNVEKTEYLPFHKMGEYKWKALNLPYALSHVEPPSAHFMAQLSRHK